MTHGKGVMERVLDQVQIRTLVDPGKFGDRQGKKENCKEREVRDKEWGNQKAK